MKRLLLMILESFWRKAMHACKKEITSTIGATCGFKKNMDFKKAILIIGLLIYMERLQVSDGLPLARGLQHLREENENTFYYRQQGEMILREISSGTLSASKMSIRTNHFLFRYIIESGICYIVLCDSSYPRKLVLHCLEDLEKELKKVDIKLLETISRPYSCTRFDYVIEHIRKQYLDSRTQANLSKLNSSQRKDIEVMTEDISNVLKNGQETELHHKVHHPVQSLQSGVLSILRQEHMTFTKTFIMQNIVS
ncbi:hypothetical protein H6P81_017011 [Aristolochia fimbriata]|uniref:Longin domain-containing protein n=1 Tax=Aristolochia fimbriata TaxID=158543 RepID=A0AAV7DX62_ARIFI|nr:hypothetical protein H6P81_017011 [Aristolochia fimbriata]